MQQADGTRLEEPSRYCAWEWETIYVVLTTLPGRMNAVLHGRRERDKLGTR